MYYIFLPSSHYLKWGQIAHCWYWSKLWGSQQQHRTCALTTDNKSLVRLFHPYKVEPRHVPGSCSWFLLLMGLSTAPCEECLKWLCAPSKGSPRCSVCASLADSVYQCINPTEQGAPTLSCVPVCTVKLWEITLFDSESAMLSMVVSYYSRNSTLHTTSIMQDFKKILDFSFWNDFIFFPDSSFPLDSSFSTILAIVKFWISRFGRISRIFWISRKSLIPPIFLI
jgi:hypothetical protein